MIDPTAPFHAVNLYCLWIAILREINESQPLSRASISSRPLLLVGPRSCLLQGSALVSCKSRPALDRLVASLALHAVSPALVCKVVVFQSRVIAPLLWIAVP